MDVKAGNAERKRGVLCFWKQIVRHLMEQTSGKCQDESNSFTTKSHPEKQEDISGVYVKNEDRASAGVGICRGARTNPTTEHRKNAWGFLTQRTSREHPETDGNARGLAQACSPSNRNGSPVM